jgi:hypothetical protein
MESLQEKANRNIVRWLYFGVFMLMVQIGGVQNWAWRLEGSFLSPPS